MSCLSNKTKNAIPNQSSIGLMKALRRASLIQTLILLALFPAFACLPMTAYSNPAGEIVIHGDVTFSRDGSTLNINQMSDQAIIEWQSFSIDANEATIFSQPGAESSALNRVTGSDPSNIMGSLRANGNIWLINPNGILFGPGSVVDVNGLLASTLEVSNDDFLNGEGFHLKGNSDAGIKNYGHITSAEGDVFFAARTVENHGFLGAVDGRVVVVGGKDVLVESGARGGKIMVNGTPNGGAHILNTGEIVAADVFLKAANNNVYGAAVNTTGLIRADGVEDEGGRVELVATGGGGVNIAGEVIAEGGQVDIGGGEINIAGLVSTAGQEAGSISIGSSSRVNVMNGAILDATGPTGGSVEIEAVEKTDIFGTVVANGTDGRGGEIEITGNEVMVGGDVTADGSMGGGEVLIGGSFQGSDPDVLNSESTTLLAGSSVSASATENGDGGIVVAWSDGETDFQRGAEINAEGVGSTSTGGFVEVSGVDTLTFTGAVSTAGEFEDGTVLLDPTDVTISLPGGGGDIEGDALQTALAGGDVVIHTTGTGGAGNITFDYNNSGSGELFVYDSNNDLSFFAHENIIWDGFLNNDGGGNVTLVAGWDGDYDFGAAPSGTSTDRVTAENVLNGTFGDWGGGSSGTITMNNGFRTVGVGSAHGETNLFSNVIDASTGNQNGEFVQIGYTNSRNPRATNALSVGDETVGGNVNAGDINVHVRTALLMTSNGGNARYMQIGHGGINRQSANRDPNNLGLTDLEGTGNTPDGNIHGDITVDAGVAIVINGSGNDSGYRLIGHGGGSVTDEILGNLSGDISVTAGIIDMEAGQGNRTFAQIGHGGFDRKGEFSGDIDVTANLGGISITGGTGSHAQSWAQIGHGGFDSDHINGLPIHVLYNSTGQGASAGDFDFSPFATGTLGENRIGFEAPTVGQINAQNLAEGLELFNVDETVTVNGVSGLTRKAGHHGNITVTALRDIEIYAGSDDDDYGMIGHGGRLVMGEFSGDITVEAQNGSVRFDRLMQESVAQSARAFVQVGHGGHQSGAGSSGDISVTAGGGGIEFYGGRNNGFAQIGHGGRQDIRGANNDPNAHDNNFAQGTLTGDILLDATGNIIFRSGFGRAGANFSQVGHGGFENAAGIVEADAPILEDLNGDGDTTDNDEEDNYLGEGHNGDITLRSGGYIDFYAGQREFAVTKWVETSPGVFEEIEILPADELREGQADYEQNPTNDGFTMIGHGGRRSFGDHWGNIDVEADGLISIEATGGWNAVGYSNNPETTGGPNNENNRGEVTGDVDPDSGIPGILRYGENENNARNGERNFAQIGHGGHDTEHLGLNTGDRRDRTGANSRGFGYLGESNIRVVSNNGGIRAIASQRENIGRQRDQFLTYDISAGWVSPDLAPTQTNFTDRIDPLTGLLLPGAVESSFDNFAHIGHGGLFNEIRGEADVANVGRAPGLYGNIDVEAAGDIDLIASNFVRGIEPGSTQGLNATWVAGDTDNTGLFDFEQYDLAFHLDAIDGTIDGFVGPAADGVTVNGYTVPGTSGPLAGYNPDFVIETINADNGGTELIGPDGVIPQVATADTGFRSVVPYIRQDNSINAFNASTNADDSYAMIGHGGRQSSQGTTIGDINVTSGGDLHLDAGSAQISFAKIGHGGYGGGPNNPTYVEGDVNVDVQGNIRLDSGQREDSYAQIGHAGSEYNLGNAIGYYTVRNADINVISHTGDIILDADNYFPEFTDPNEENFREKLKDAPGFDDSGESTVLIRDFNFASNNTNLRNHRQEYAMIGHGGVQSDMDVDADITVQATQGSIRMQSGILNGQYTQIGHGGQFLDGGNAGSPGTPALLGEVTVDAFGDIELIGGDTVSEFQLHGDNNTGVGIGGLGILDNEGQRPIEGTNNAYPNDFTAGGQNAFYAYSKIGHGGNRLGNNQRGVRIEGNINVNTVLTEFDPEADLTLEAGDGRGAFAMVGHGGTEVDNGEGFIGAINVNISDDIRITGGERLRNGGLGLQNEENFAQIGHSTMRDPGGAVNSNSEGDITVNAGGDITLLAGGGSFAHARIGSGANLNSANQTQVGDHVGDITVVAGGDLTMQGARPGSEDLGNEYLAEYVEGEINVNDVFVVEDGRYSFAQIGHGGTGNDSLAGFDGDIDIRVAGDLRMNGDVLDENGDPVLIEIDQYAPVDSVAQSGTAFDAYAKIGHGDYLTLNSGTSAGGFANGDISVKVGESAYIHGGFIGHEGNGNLIPIEGSTYIGVSRNNPSGEGVLSVESLTIPGEIAGNTNGTEVDSAFSSGFVGDTPSNSGELRIYVPGRAQNLIADGTLLNGTSYVVPSGPLRADEFAPFPEFTFTTNAEGLPVGEFSGTEGGYIPAIGYGVYYATGASGGGGGGNGGGAGAGDDLGGGFNDGVIVDGGTGGVNTGGTPPVGPILPPPPRFTPFQLILIDIYNNSLLRREQERELNPESDFTNDLQLYRELIGDPTNGTDFSVEFLTQGIDSSDMDKPQSSPGATFQVFGYDFLYDYMTDPSAPVDGVIDVDQTTVAPPAGVGPDNMSFDSENNSETGDTSVEDDFSFE